MSIDFCKTLNWKRIQEMQLNDEMPNYLKWPHSTDTDLNVERFYKWMKRIGKMIGCIELSDLGWGVVGIDNWSWNLGLIDLWTCVN